MKWSELGEQGQEYMLEKAMNDLLASLDIYEIMREFGKNVFGDNNKLIDNDITFVDAFCNGKGLDLNHVECGFIGIHATDDDFIQNYFYLLFGGYEGFYIEWQRVAEFRERFNLTFAEKCGSI